MHITKTPQSAVRVVCRQVGGRTSKTITLYDCDPDDVIALITREVRKHESQRTHPTNPGHQNTSKRPRK